MQMRYGADRGYADWGWLKTHHTFSFSNYYDPKETGFGDLLVINDDHVAPGRGFGTHPHQDMEIFTYVLDGELSHKDSMGNGSTILPGDVQMMSAGTGIQHSEYNSSASKPLHLLQIWITPDQKGVTPRYQQIHFSPEQKRGKFKMIIGPKADTDTETDALDVYQDARVYAGLFDGNESATLLLPPNRNAYVHLARGELEVNSQLFKAGDGARLRGDEKIEVKNGKDAEILVFDMRPVEQPEF